MILEVFSNLNDSMILFHKVVSSACYRNHASVPIHLGSFKKRQIALVTRLSGIDTLVT